MKRETGLLRILTAAALAAALFALFRLFPLTGDDWFREGLGASLHSAGDLVRAVAEKWRTTNGRILGNVLAYSAGSRPLLRDVLRTGITLTLCALLARVSGLRSPARLLLCAAAALALPRELFREVYPWAAGYFNYVPPVVCLLAVFALAEELFEDRPVSGGASRCAALFVLAFAAQLFVENVTVCTLAAAAVLNLWHLLRHKCVSSALVCCLLGALGGAALLFASPSYLAIFSDGGSYAADVTRGLAGLFASAQENAPTVFRFLLTDCPVLYGSLAALLTLFFARARKCAADGALLAALLLGTAALPLRGVLALSDGAAAALCLVWFLLAALGALRWTRGAVRARTLLFLFAALCAALPLLFVSPIGPRCLYASYLLLLTAAFSLLAGSGREPRFAFPTCAGLCAAVLLFFASVYLPLHRTDEAQREAIRTAMARGERSVAVPAYADDRWLWEPDTPKMEHAYYYFTPGDLTIEFETR